MKEKLEQLRAENKSMRSMLGRIQIITSEFLKQKQKAESVPFQGIAQLWNVMASNENLPLVEATKLPTTLKGQIRQRHKDLNSDLKRWDNFFKYISNNDFLAGRATPGRDRSTPFRATLLWVTKEINFHKISAKEYDQ